jgi:hypothetical protein
MHVGGLRERITSHTLPAALFVVAVCVAAFIAHVAIDVVGDYALPHDTYDGVAHDSRVGVVVAAIGLALAAAFGVLWSALQSACRSSARGRRARVVGSPLLFGAAVVVAVVALVAGMEAIDVVLAGARVDSVSDMLGGSVFLGLALTLPIALCAALGALRVARFVEHATVLLARVIVAMVMLLNRIAVGDPRAARERAPLFHLLAIHLGRAHKRGPPLPA